MTETSSWYAADVATFGDRLVGARDGAGLSQEELAQRLGVRLTTVQAWEEDLAEPRGNRLQMLAGMLNVSLSWLLTAEGDGLAAPDAPAALSAPVEDAMSELRQMRARAETLALDLGKMEKKLRQLMRQEA